MGGGNNAGMRVARGRYFFLLNSDAWVVGDALERLVRFADEHPEAAVIGPRLLNTDGTLQRSVRGEPTLWRLATEYLFIRKLAPRSQLLNPLYAGGFAHDEVREVESLYGPALLVRREAVDAVGLFDEAFFMFSEEVDWLTRFRRAGWKVLFFPGRRGRPRRRRDARRPALRREPARPPALVRQAQGPAAGRAGAAPPARVAAPARARLAARPARRRDARGHPLPVVRLTPGRCCGDRLPAPRASARPSCCAPGAAVARALGQRTRAATLAWALAALFVAWAVVFTVHGEHPAGGRRARCWSGRWRWACDAAFRSRARSRTRAGSGSRARGVVWLGGVVLGWLLWHVEGPVTGRRAVPRGARAQARRARQPAPAHGRRVQGRRPAPRLRLPALARLPRARRVGLAARSRARSSATSRRCSRRSPACSRGSRASRVFGSAWAGVGRCSSPRSPIFCFGPGHGGSYATLALPGTTARQLLVPAALVLFFGWVGDTLARGARRRRRRSSARSRSSIRRTRSSCSCPSGGYALLRPRRVAAVACRARRGARAGGARRALAEADRRRDALAQPGREAARAEHRAVPLAARRVEQPPLPSRPGGAGTERRGRRRGARAAAASPRSRAAGAGRRSRSAGRSSSWC